MDTTSYAKVVNQFNLSEERMNEECSFDTILRVHKRFSEWRNIAPYLLMPDKAQKIVKIIDQDLRLDEVGKRLDLLTRWKQSLGSDATHKKLVQAFLSSDRRDLAEEVCQAISRGEFITCML